jgi:hypothetical protein
LHSTGAESGRSPKESFLYTAYAGGIDEVPGHLTVLDLATGSTKVLSETAFKGFRVR